MHLLGWHEEVLDKSPQQWILFSVDRNSRLRPVVSAMGKRGKNKKKLWKCCQRIKWDFPVTKWLAGRLVQPNQYIHSFDQCYWIRMFVEHAQMDACWRSLEHSLTPTIMFVFVFVWDVCSDLWPLQMWWSLFCWLYHTFFVVTIGVEVGGGFVVWFDCVWNSNEWRWNNDGTLN